MMKKKYYSLKPILEKNALYNVIFSGRSNGKTYAVIRYALEKYFKTGEQLAILRRWEEDFVGAASARTMYESLINNGNGENDIKELSGGEYDGVEYYAGRYFLTVYDEEKGRSLRTDKVIAYAFALTQHEHYKSGSFPNITTIFFDEFITKGIYLQDEFIKFQSICSTIIRQRGNVTIFMCGNTVNQYNPYFGEMGLYNAAFMKKGSIDIYTYGESGLTCAVEYAEMPPKKKVESSKYFAFKNSKLRMITEGDWELDIYPHCPCKILPKDILFTYFVIFNNNILQCEICMCDRKLFTFVHLKSGDIKYPESDLVYSFEPSPLPNRSTNFLRPKNAIEKKILQLYLNDKYFYQSNEVGEMFTNFINNCKSKV